MLRMFYAIFMNLFRAPYIIPQMRREAAHPEKYSEEQRYQLARHIVYLMKRTGKIKTIAYGLENLPKEGGYIMYPNHQGKYDLLGIVHTHKAPCTFVMDKEKSHTIVVREFCDLVQGKRLEKDNPRQGIRIIDEVAKDIIAGKRYVLFPEGGYEFNNKNCLSGFKAGSFKIALKSKCPVIPVVLIDSYKVFNSWYVGPVTTYIYYLTPIYYDEYKGMKSKDLAALVRERIQAKIDEVTESGREETTKTAV